MSKVLTARELYTPEFVHKYNALQKQFFTKRQDPSRKFLRESIWLHVLLGNSILDIGCGDGKDAAYYQAHGYEVWGVDSSEAMIALAREKAQDEERFFCQDFRELRPQTFGPFDAITSRFALHYVDDIDRAYTVMARLLNPLGILAVITAHPFKDAKFATKVRGHRSPIVRYPLFGGKIIMEYPAHTLEEYLSPSFFRRFELLAIHEEPPRYREHDNIPGHLGILARKK